MYSFIMRFPSFIQLPLYRRFTYRPRYYQAETAASFHQNEDSKDTQRLYFRRRLYVRPLKGRSHALRFVLMLVFMAMFVGYFFYGALILWISCVLGILFFVFYRYRQWFRHFLK